MVLHMALIVAFVLVVGKQWRRHKRRSMSARSGTASCGCGRGVCRVCDGALLVLDADEHRIACLRRMAAQARVHGTCATVVVALLMPPHLGVPTLRTSNQGTRIMHTYAHTHKQKQKPGTGAVVRAHVCPKLVLHRHNTAQHECSTIQHNTP